MALLTTSAHRKEEKKKKCIEVNPLREREREREGILWELHPTTTTRRWHTQCVSDAEPGQLNNTRPAALRVTTQHIQPDDVDAHSGWIINDIAVIYCSDTQLRLSIHFPKGVLCIELYTDNIYFDMMLVFMRDVQQKLKSPHHCIDLYFWPLVKVLASFFLLTGQFLPDFSCMDPYKNFPHARRTAPAFSVSRLCCEFRTGATAAACWIDAYQMVDGFHRPVDKLRVTNGAPGRGCLVQQPK